MSFDRIVLEEVVGAIHIEALLMIHGSKIMQERISRTGCGYLVTRSSILCEAIQFSAVEFAREKDIDVIICGHTHVATLVQMDHVIYGNDGTWQSDDPHFIGIRNQTVSLCKFVADTPIEVRSVSL